MPSAPKPTMTKVSPTILAMLRRAVQERYGTVYGHMEDEVNAALFAHTRRLKELGPVNPPEKLKEEDVGVPPPIAGDWR